MTAPRLRPASIAAAGGLAIFTLLVFGLLPNYGPASALRRFHQAIIDGDEREVRRVVMEPLDATPARRVIGVVGHLLQNGYVSVARPERSPREVRVVMLYRDDNGQPFPIVFVVEKQQHQWRINLSKTDTIFNDYLYRALQ